MSRLSVNELTMSVTIYDELKYDDYLDRIVSDLKDSVKSDMGSDEKQDIEYQIQAKDMELKKKGNLNYIQYSFFCTFYSIYIILVLIIFKLISFLGVEDTGLKTEERHVAEHLAIFCEGYTYIIWHQEHILLLGRIPHHSAEAHSVMDTDHRIVVDFGFLLDVQCIQILVAQSVLPDIDLLEDVLFS